MVSVAVEEVYSFLSNVLNAKMSLLLFYLNGSVSSLYNIAAALADLLSLLPFLRVRPIHIMPSFHWVSVPSEFSVTRSSLAWWKKVIRKSPRRIPRDLVEEQLDSKPVLEKLEYLVSSLSLSLVILSWPESLTTPAMIRAHVNSWNSASNSSRGRSFWGRNYRSIRKDSTRWISGWARDNWSWGKKDRSWEEEGS